LRAVAGAALVAGAVAALLAAVYMSKTAAIESTLAKSAECISVDRLIKVARETAPSGENFRNFFESGQNSAELKKVIDEINQCASGVSANYLQAVRIQLKLDSSRGMYIVPSTLSPYADLREPPVLAAGQTSFVGWLHGLMRNWQSSLHASRPLATKDREVVGVVTYY
jgi:hypothetical protein